MKEIKSILVSQPKPTDNNSPYYLLAKKHDLKIDFRKFISIEPITYWDFKKQKINIQTHSAVIFTSRNAVDHFFGLVKDNKINLPNGMKFFCISYQTGNYLQKYVKKQKRKIFIGEKTASDLLKVIAQHKNETFLFPCSNIRKDEIPNFLNKHHYSWSELTIYRTVATDLSDLKEISYDLIVFFSPSGINSLFVNFPNFKQNGTRIAAFGPTTSKAVENAGLILDISAPLPNVLSMVGALEMYIKLLKKK